MSTRPRIRCLLAAVSCTLAVGVASCKTRDTEPAGSQVKDDQAAPGVPNCIYEDHAERLVGQLDVKFGINRLKALVDATLRFGPTSGNSTAAISNVSIFPPLILLKLIVNKIIAARNRPSDAVLLTGAERQSLPDWKDVPCGVVGVTRFTYHDLAGGPANDTVITFAPAIPFFIWHQIADGEMEGTYTHKWTGITATVIQSTMSSMPKGAQAKGDLVLSQPGGDRHKFKLDFGFLPESGRRGVGLGTTTTWTLNADRSRYATLMLVDTNELNGKEVPLTLVGQPTP